MENSYGVGVVNRYALFLDDESDPLEAIKATERARELRKKSKDAEKENKGKPEPRGKALAGGATPGAGGAPPSQPGAPRKGIKETQPNVKSERPEGKGKPGGAPVPASGAGGERGERRPPPQGAEQRPPRRPREDRPDRPDRPNGPGGPGAPGALDGKERPPRREYNPDRRPRFDGEPREARDGERRGPPRGPRPDREREPRQDRDRDGPRGPRPDNRGKREFDRRSGSEKTGVKSVDKREGGGAHNWGNHKDDLEELNKTASDGAEGEEKQETGAGDAAKEGVPAEPSPPVEEEPRVLTLDEYKALRNATRQKPQYNLRKAGEGEDLTQWKNMIVLEKKKEGEHDDDSDDEYDMADYPQRVGRQKRLLGIEFTFNDNARRGGVSGGRGRGRGGVRGAPRGPRAPEPREQPPVEERRAPRQVAPPKVDDSKDFPSLG